MHAQGSWRRNKTVSTYLLAGLTMSAKRDDQTAISKSLKSGTLPTFTMLMQKPSERRESAQGASI